MRKKLALILALVMLVSILAACGGDDPVTPPPPPPNGGGDTPSNNGGDDPDPPPPAFDPITFTFYDEDGTRDKPWNTPVAEEITRLTGVSLVFERPVGGADVMIPLMTASGDYPDLIYGKGTGSNQLIEAQALLNLDDYMENSRYLKDFYGELMGRMRVSEDDPHIYTVGAYPINQPNWEPSSEMGVQLAVLEEFGYPNIRTIYDVEKLLIDYKDLYPEIDGRPTFGFSLNNADGWRYIIDVGNPSGFIIGYPDHGEWILEESTLEAYVKYLHPGIKEYYQWMNKMWNIGMIDPDCWTQTHDDWKAKIANGQVLAIVSPNWMVDEAEQSARQAGLDNRTYSRMPINITADTVSKIRYDFGWSGSWGVGITVSCADPDRAFQFLDWMASDESQVLRYWGIEGVHYTVEDGVRVQVPEVQHARVNDPNYGNEQGLDWVYPFPERGFGVLDPTGNPYSTTTPDTIIENYSDAAKRALEAYGVTMWADLFPPPSTFPLARVGAAWQIDIPTDSEINDYIQLVQQTLMPRMVPAAIMAAPDQFDARWDEFLAAIRDAGSDEAHAEFTELVRGTARLFGTD
ncbi:MAG: extracellular solute-binding protein [Oscillospiraceae bacterium]|jgi:putative aldouronate transport system substrate-binding protein|nr:extracellular solute-binding protein [Oscillospiraceae bacterium]